MNGKARGKGRAGGDLGRSMWFVGALGVGLALACTVGSVSAGALISSWQAHGAGGWPEGIVRVVLAKSGQLTAIALNRTTTLGQNCNLATSATQQLLDAHQIVADTRLAASSEFGFVSHNCSVET